MLLSGGASLELGSKSVHLVGCLARHEDLHNAQEQIQLEDLRAGLAGVGRALKG